MNTESGWYIAVKKPNPTRFVLMAGPYDTRQDADAQADRCKEIAYQVDGFLWFETWGTGLFKTREPGQLNRLMESEP